MYPSIHFLTRQANREKLAASKALTDTAREAAVYERKVFEDRTNGALQEAKKNGMIFNELSDRDKWVERMRPVWEAFAKSTPGAAELIAAIQAS